MDAPKLWQPLTDQQQDLIRAGTVQITVTKAGTITASREGRTATARTPRQAIELLRR